MTNRQFFPLVAGLAIVALLFVPLFGHAVMLDLSQVDPSLIGVLPAAAAFGHLVDAGELSLAVRSKLMNLGIPLQILDSPRALARMSWEELHSERAIFRKANERLLEEARKADSSEAKLSKEEGATLTRASDYMLAVAANLSTEIDERHASGNKEPRRSGREGLGLRGAQPRDDDRGGIWFRDIHSGQAVRGVQHGESIRAAFPHVVRPAAPLGEFIRSVAIGRPTIPELEDEFRTLLTTTSGVQIPVDYAGALIDLAREESSVSRAGAVFVPMTTKTLEIAKITGDPTVEWKAENSAGTASDPSLTTVTLASRTLIILVKTSEEAAMDSPNFGSMIEKLLREAAGAELDRVGLVGSGVGAEPQGIYGGTDVQTYNVGGTPASYGFVSQMVQKIRTENHVPNALFMHPRTYGTLDRLVDTTGQPLMAPKSFTDLTHYQSTRIPINIENGASPNDGTIAIAGKFSELLIGTRLSGLLHVSRETNDGTDSAFTKFQLHFRFVMRMDVQLARGKAFCVGLAIND